MRASAQSRAVAVVLALLGLLVWDVAHSERRRHRAARSTGDRSSPRPTSRGRASTAHGKITLASLRGKVVVVNFWQSYCAPCTQEATTLDAAARELGGQGRRLRRHRRAGPARAARRVH